MSHVTDILVLASCLDEPGETATDGAIANLNAYLRSDLVRLDEMAGGSKAMQATVWAGAYNYLNIEEFLAKVWEQKWELAADVQVLLKDEHDDRWTLHSNPNHSGEPQP